MIELKNVNKFYSTKQGTLAALRDINLNIRRGEILGVIGKSGAGKSTLIRCVNLLERPSSGQIFVNGQDLTTLHEKALRQARHKIGMIFQQFNLLNTRTVYQNIAFPLELQGVGRVEVEHIVVPLLELINLEEKSSAYPYHLSGGQKQRVAIARALATKPNILLCDEMTSALDPQTTSSILKLVKEINQQLNLSILLITHEMEVIKTIADKVAVIDQGQVIEQADIVSIFKHPQAEITKTFVQSALAIELPDFLRNKLLQAPIDTGHTVFRITFSGRQAVQPIIDYLVRHFDVHLNILQANIEYLRNDTIGMMIVAAEGSREEMEKVFHYLQEQQIEAEVLGYVRADNWLAS